MATKFSKGKFVEVQEKKAKTGLKEGLLSKRHCKDDESSKGEDPVVTSNAQPTFQRPTSPTLSLELITPSNKGTKTRAKEKLTLSTFWDEAYCVVAKVHDAISVEDLKPLMLRLK